MGIKIAHGRPETLLTAAQMKGEERVAQQELERTERLQAQQREFEYRTAIRQQDMAIDLQMQERAKAWEIEKMELRSRMDFQREEQQRVRKLDSLDSAIQQIDKEVLAGRMTEQEAYPIKQKLELSKLGINVPVSAFPGDEEDKYGVDPYWMRGEDAPPGSPERMLYEAEMKRRIEGATGTVPYHLSTKFLRSLPPATAQEMLEVKGIFFDSDGEFEEWLAERESGVDIGVRAEPQAEPEDGRIRVVSPEGETGTILESELQEYINQGFTIVGESKAFRGVGAQGAWEEPLTEIPAAKRVKRRKATVGTIDWDYIMSKGFK